MMLLNRANNPALQRVINIYMGAILFIAPFTSLVLFPSASASVPCLVAVWLFLPLFLYFSFRRRDGFLKEFLIIASVFIGINVLAQAYVYFSGVALTSDLVLTKADDPNRVFLRRSMFTQSAYLFGGLLLYLYVKHYAHWRHLNYFYWGLRVLAIYGLLEILLFQLTGKNGDFLSNRQFDHTPGSLFQTMKVGPLVVQRLKSLTGEPSMFAFTVVPFWILAVGLRRTVDIVLLGITLLLTFSTSAYLGIVILALAVVVREPKIRKYSLWFIPVTLLIGVVLYFMSPGFHHFLHDIILDKLTGANTSGQERGSFMRDHMHFWLYDMNIAGKFTGLGFGYVRSTDFFSTLLVNNGIIGVVLFTWFYFKHAFSITRNTKGARQIRFYYRTALIATYIIMMLSVPEFGYMSLWVLLASGRRLVTGRIESRTVENRW
ncbi:hypothetical protein [Filimonas effusa]|uniref:O-antigen ligase domain-containing protein n=1 Tax=Filimonas effusa TaxID=2508721 RepID=A0A4V1M9N8_9BACT|nr:hypothetical protein [Filimonas effusa]RXK81860.1 hypothetical protein ESB13_18910 [Filimonas effusa]